MKIGSAGVALVKSFESCRLVAYPDQRGIPTIGWGHTGPEVHLGLVWTQAQADTAFVADLQRAVIGVLKSLDVAVGQNAFDALVCFTYNVGVDAEAHSTLLKLVNARSPAAAAEFLKWDHTNGVENPGLLRRRQAEQKLFLLADQAPPSAS